MFLITAHPRSGTCYTAQLLANMGLKVKHEQIGEQGTVSWKHVKDKRFEQVFLQVRNPLDAISSSVTVRNIWMKRMHRYCGLEPTKCRIYNAMVSWYHFNKFILKTQTIVHTYKVENITNEINKILEIAKLNVDVKIIKEAILKTSTRRYNSRNHIILDWKTLKEKDEELTNKIIKLGNEFGYFE